MRANLSTAGFGWICVIICHHLKCPKSGIKIGILRSFKNVMLTVFSRFVWFCEHLLINHCFHLYIRPGIAKMDIYINVQKRFLFHQFHVRKRGFTRQDHNFFILQIFKIKNKALSRQHHFRGFCASFQTT